LRQTTLDIRKPVAAPLAAPSKWGILECLSSTHARSRVTVRATRKMSNTAPKTAPAPASFETALAELETIVATMEGGQLPLAESLAAYKRGAELLQYCQAALKDAQQQVQMLERGVLKSFEPDGAEAPGPGEVDEP
jgi:exodeoxyribonuclease VII small subunit